MEVTYADILKSSRSWQDDYEMENGMYQNTCAFCKHPFFGHKYRRVCKKCNEGKEVVVIGGSGIGIGKSEALAMAASIVDLPAISVLKKQELDRRRESILAKPKQRLPKIR